MGQNPLLGKCLFWCYTFYLSATNFRGRQMFFRGKQIVSMGYPPPPHEGKSQRVLVFLAANSANSSFNFNFAVCKSGRCVWYLCANPLESWFSHCLVYFGLVKLILSWSSWDRFVCTTRGWQPTARTRPAHKLDSKVYELLETDIVKGSMGFTEPRQPDKLLIHHLKISFL